MLTEAVAPFSWANLPDEIVQSVSRYLAVEPFASRGEPGNKEMAMPGVCRSWYSAFQIERAAAHRANLHRDVRLLGQYSPLLLEQICKKNFILQLPVLDLGDRVGTTAFGTELVDFIRQEDMAHPIMRFQDVRGRPGIAVKVHTSKWAILRYRLRVDIRNHIIEGRNRQRDFFVCIRLIMRIFARTLKEGDAIGVLVLYQSRPNHGMFPGMGLWTCSGSREDSAAMARLCRERQLVYMKNHSMIEKPRFRKFFQSLLNGQQGDFAISGRNNSSRRRRGLCNLVSVLTGVAIVCLMGARFCWP